MKLQTLENFSQDVQHMTSILPGFKSVNFEIQNDTLVQFEFEHFSDIKNKIFNENILKTLKYLLETKEGFQEIVLETNVEIKYINLIKKKSLTRTLHCDDCDKTFYYQMVTHCPKEKKCTFKTC